MRLNSIRTRTTAGFTLTMAFLMLLACGGLTAYARHAAARRADQLLSATARRVLRELAPEGPGAEDDDHRDEADEPHEETDARHREADARHEEIDAQHVDLPGLIDQERDSLAASHLAMLVVDAKGQVSQKSQVRVPRWPRTGDDGWRVLAVPFDAHTIVIALPWAGTVAALNNQALTLLSLGLFGILIAATGSWLLVGRTLSPIASLSRQARSASADRLGMHLCAPSQDAEVVELVATLNALLTRLAETAAAKGRFYAAASHELRTPLQALSGHLELALDRPRTNEEYRVAMVEAREQARLLTSLTRALLWLHQLETAPRLPDRGPVSLADLCERTLAQFAPLISERGLRLQVGLGTDAVILSPRSHAEMLIRNLIENAVRYAVPGGAVRVELFPAAEPELLVFNACRVDAELTVERLFEPFCRPDAARATGTGGNGLGLTICKAIAVANGWKLTWQQEGGGVWARVTFRAAQVGAK